MASKPDFDRTGVAQSVDPLSELRGRAIDKAAHSGTSYSDSPGHEQAQVLLEELRVHQIELEMQNDELRRVQGDLEASRSRYFDLYNLAPIGYLTVGSDDKILEANLRAATMFTVIRSALVGRRFTSYIAPESQDNHYLIRAQLLQTGAAQFCELKMIPANGSPFWARLELLITQEGEAQVYRIVIVDISERHRLEEALIEANARLTEERTAAENATRAKTQFLSAMSHEIRTPLNGVVGMAGLLLQTELSCQQLAYARIVSGSAEALLGLVNNILDVSKIEAGRFELEETSFDLESLIEDVLEITSFKAREKSLELTYRYKADLPRQFFGDGGRVRQVLMNLVSNSVKFTRAGYVLVEVKPGEVIGDVCTVSLSVHDTGIGISKGNLGHLFSRFGQADPTIARRYGGTGLGLSIVKQIVELMGGEIGVSSVESEGSTFTCEIPLKLNRAHSAVQPDTACLTGVSVLISGSHKIACSVIAEWCRGWGMEVKECDLADLRYCVRDALHRFVIVDADSRTLLDSLADFHAEAASAAPKLVLLASDSVESLSRLAADAVLSAPVRSRVLLGMLCNLVGRPAAAHQPQLPNLVSSPLESSNLSKFKVLVADDNLINQKLACTLLARLGCEVDTAADGAEAVTKVSGAEYGLVLMDCVMPVMDGFDATIAIRNLAGKFARTPIVALTASATAEDRDHCLSVGMDDFISKPIRPEQLAACVKQWSKGTGFEDNGGASELPTPP